MPELVVVETVEAGVATLTLNRPQRRNALSIALLEGLCEAMDRLAGDSSNRVAILRGAGPVFSAGLDLTEAADSSLVERSANAVQHALDKLRRSSLIVVAAVHGGAYAGGAGLMAACDIVVAADDAKIGFPEARHGLLPALICGVLKDKVGEGNLRDLFFTGDAIDATRAQQIGLVQRITSADRLTDESLNVARSILTGGPDTIRKTKQLINDVYRGSSNALIDAHLAARESAEAREGLAAFNEKRKPTWL